MRSGGEERSRRWRGLFSAWRTASVDYLFPPAVKEEVALALHRLRKDATIFEGDYPTWQDAERASNGYADPEILERTRRAALRAKNDPGVFERDSMILAQPEYSFPALSALLWVANRNAGRLKVLDFGGSLGSSFFQFRRFLGAIPALEWAVVEQPHFVECGKREIGGSGLTFHPTVASALGELKPDVLFLSSVLQYLPTPHETLAELLAQRFDFILLDRTAFHRRDRDRLTIQRNPPSIHSASYPAWFFNKEQLLRNFRDRYNLVYEFSAGDRVLLAGGRADYLGFFFERAV
jgi:putative methyltransferase (TIGR04325 family)